MYDEVLKSIREWFYSISVKYSDQVIISIERDDSSVFIVNIDSDIYLGQISVSEPEWRPYRYIDFTILDIRKDIGQVPVFWYGDDENSTVQDIIDNLNKGLDFLLTKK